MLMLKQNIRGRELDSCGLGVRGIGEPEGGLYFFFCPKNPNGYTFYVCYGIFINKLWGKFY